ncbi:MAG: hypothetical protein KGK07_15250 [Chloroflexota bacterium]|nr:hypothetical protein [Chloroflexota bacterium]
MDKLHELVDALRKRVAGLKEAASLCPLGEDRFALQVRADEAERCAEVVEKTAASMEVH